MSDTNRSKRILDLCEQALDQSEDEREQFVRRACEDDQELRESVESVLVAIRSSEHHLGDDNHSDGTELDFTGRQILNYSIQASLGKGGMGSVYLAHRREPGFDQQVAIKFVHGHMLAKELFERFNAERQILAGLNHPYIAALIDGGSTPEGIPYIVMEYIDGQPIDEYCDSRNLSLTDRIRLIQKIATAVQAAHQNLVVHRDLKPSNVLVTKDGIPKLLDFGIAKLIQPTEADHHGNTTLFGHQALTPDYASPEQILENTVTTASDVYSLGVLAYQLLAGERPYHIQTTSHRELIASVEGLTVPRPSTRLDTIAAGETVEEIARKRATTPSKLKRALAGDLDNILIKALHRDADRRYGSISAFSADLKRFLEGLPVEARPDTIGYRFSRFVSRNRLAVSAGVALAIALLAGLGATGWAYLRAEEARIEASLRFDQVRNLANTMMFDVFGEIENLPGSKSARQQLASTAQEYLATLSRDPSAPVDVLHDAARGYSRLSSILTDQAVSDAEFRQRADEAAAQSMQLYDQLATRDDVTLDVLRGYAELYANRGKEQLYNLNDAVASRQLIETALTAYDRALQLESDNAGLIADVIMTEVWLADTFKWQNDFANAEAMLNDILEYVGVQTNRFPEDHDLFKAAGDAYFLRGEVRAFDGRQEEAVVDYEKALDVYAPIEAANPERNPVRQTQVIAAWSLGNSLVELDRPAEAEDHYRKAMALTEIRFVRDPSDRNAQRTYQILRGSLAASLVRTGKEQEAIEQILSVNDWFEEQLAVDPGTPGPHRSVAVGYHEVANIYEAAGRKSEACEWYARTLAKWEDIDQRFGISEFDAEQPDVMRELLAAC